MREAPPLAPSPPYHIHLLFHLSLLTINVQPSAGMQLEPQHTRGPCIMCKMHDKAIEISNALRMALSLPLIEVPKLDVPKEVVKSSALWWPTGVGLRCHSYRNSGPGGALENHLNRIRGVGFLLL